MRKRTYKAFVAGCLAFAMVAGNASVLSVEAAKKEVIGTNYYIDSENGNDEVDGLSPKTAWKSLENVDGREFEPGDKILFKAGTEYEGKFYPQGSGTAENPISIDIYDGNVIGKEAGERAAIHAGGESAAAIELENVNHWNISNMEVTNQELTTARDLWV